MLNPLRDKLFVHVDPETRMVGSLHIPDVDTIKYCDACHQMMEALGEKPCVGSDIFEYDKYHTDRPVFRGVDRSHKVKSVTAPVIETSTKFATVIRCGPKCVDVSPGDRIVIDHVAGGIDDYRTIRECEILGVVND